MWCAVWKLRYWNILRKSGVYFSVNAMRAKNERIVRCSHGAENGILSNSNSHIWYSRSGRALLCWRNECGRLWVILGSAMQAPIHSVACVLILINFYQLQQALYNVYLSFYRRWQTSSKFSNTKSSNMPTRVISSHYINQSLTYISGSLWDLKLCQILDLAI